MKRLLCLLALLLGVSSLIQAQHCGASQWTGKRVAFLGDSMTDPGNKSADTKYWALLQESMGIEPYVFARSGYEWRQMLSKAKELNDSLGQDVDAIIIWCGTNDYNHSKPVGEFYTETVDTVNVNGSMLPRKHRQWVMADSTYCGSINMALSYLKQTYPSKQIIVMTPIHRGYACFGERNVQPDETYANGQNLYIEDYVDVLKRAAELWAVPVIDLFQISGLYPNLESQTPYVGHPDTDRLHPNNLGHRRIADTMRAQLMALPPTF